MATLLNSTARPFAGLFSALAILAALVALAPAAHAIDRVSTGRFNDLAVQGFDTTAYLRHGEPRRGTPTFEIEHNGATWRFATAEEAALFEADPDAYAPQFGGYCTRAMSEAEIAPGKARIWRLHEGKLYLFFGSAGADLFDEDPVGMIARAAAHWATLDFDD